MKPKPEIDSVPVSVEDLLAKSVPGTRAAVETASDALEAAALIRRMRRAAGLSQVGLARRLGVKPARISVLEKGDGPRGPSYALLKRVARVCGFDFDLERALIPSVEGEAESASLGLSEEEIESAPAEDRLASRAR